MLQSLNGNNPEHASYRFAIDEVSQVGEARRFALILCSDLNFEDTAKGRVAIIVNELGNNLVRYARKSHLIFRKFSTKVTSGIEILSIDSGPGMDDVLSLQDGYSTGNTPGTGLGAAKRQSDLFDIYSSNSSGTAIVSRVYSKKLPTYSLEEKISDSIEVGAINIPMRGEIVSGDGWCVHETDQGLAVAVVDGLGHGPLANLAAIKALSTFAEIRKAPVVEVLQKLHEALRGTRGAAVFLLATTADVITFTGVGNVAAILITPIKSKVLVSQNGTAGLQIGKTKTLNDEWSVGDYLIFQSDGLSSRWNLDTYPGIRGKHASLVSAILFRDFDRGSDDSTIVVIRRLK